MDLINIRDLYRNENEYLNKDLVGLMTPSDYGYGALQSICSDTKLTEYATCASNNWLYSGKEEWLLSDPLFEEVMYIEKTGNINTYLEFSKFKNIEENFVKESLDGANKSKGNSYIRK